MLTKEYIELIFLCEDMVGGNDPDELDWAR